MGYPVRRSIACLVVTAAALAAAAPAGANPQLAGLQVALRRHGLYAGAIDAVAGPQTQAALLSFQKHRKLVPDGIVGPKTRRALGSFGRPLYGTRVIKPGMRGWDVAVLQYLLTRHRLLHQAPDGIFGRKTEAAVIRFQRARGLAPDGVVGHATARTLCRLAVCTWTAKVRPRPAKKESVRDVIDRWARYYGVDRHLARGLAWQESGYQQTVVSSTGAVGVMQVMPDAWAFAETFLIRHPVAQTVDGNVRVGVAYLGHLLREFHGDERLALGAYYQGPASVRRRGLLRESRAFVADVLALKARM
jgi:Transglycosylase SLT domain/Putative peptidoglycan binding domain